MIVREEKLILELKKLASQTMIREITTLNRKLKKMEESRDEWREAAMRYQKQLLEQKRKGHDRE